ncbi:unnamed protein product [Caenorhabditis brenneri]
MTSCVSRRWATDPEYVDLLNYIIERTKNVESPMNIQSLARGFKEKTGVPQSVGCLGNRIEKLRTWIQCSEHIDTNTKVKVLFALSGYVHVYFLEEFKKNAFIEVDDKKRIIHYKSNDGSLELRGDHSQSAKNKTAQLDSKINYRKLISDYFENNGNADTIPKNKKEEEMWNLIEFITRKCDTVDSPLIIQQLATDFINHSGKSQSADTIRTRIKVYCNEIQTMEFLDTLSKVKQLFGLSATLNSEFLKKLRKDAFVEVDHKNRIIKYMSSDGSLTLRGSHWGSGNRIPRREFDSDDEAGMIEMSIEDDFKYGLPSMTLPNSIKRKTEILGSGSSKRARPSSNDSIRPNELDDYDMNYSIDDQVKLEPFFGSIQEDLIEIEEYDDFELVLKPLQAHDDHNQIEEISIKVEQEESVEVKPVTSHNSKIKFFEAMQSLILCLDTPSLSWIQSKIDQKIQKLGESDEVILNNEIALIVDLLIARMTNHSVVNLSQNVESVNLSSFLCYLKAAIQISKISGLEDLVKNISKLIGETQNKYIPTEKVANALCTTLYIDGY